MHSPAMESHGMYGDSPMLVGSPSSPMSPAGNQYLPGYLLGDATPHVGSPGPRLWSATSPSPPKSATRGNVSMSTPGPRGEVLRPKEKVGAPPTKSLMSPIGAVASPLGTPAHQLQSKGVFTPGSTSGIFPPPTAGFSQSLSDSCTQDQLSQSMMSRIPTSPAQLDPFYTQGESLLSDDALDETWVTVFGFPPAAASFILQQFSQYGNIVKHVVASEGNWMHLHYQSKLQAKKALSKNAKIFGTSIMVGVTPCIEKIIMEEEKENSSILHPSQQGVSTPGNTSISGFTNKNTPIRPLTAAYRTAKGDNEVVRNNQAPQKSNTLLSKTMEYMFGW